MSKDIVMVDRQDLENIRRKEKSLAQFEANLKKEDRRLKKAWQDFERRVQQTVDIRTIGLTHELKKAQYLASVKCAPIKPATLKDNAISKAPPSRS